MIGPASHKSSKHSTCLTKSKHYFHTKSIHFVIGYVRVLQEVGDDALSTPNTQIVLGDEFDEYGEIIPKFPPATQWRQLTPRRRPGFKNIIHDDAKQKKLALSTILICHPLLGLTSPAYYTRYQESLPRVKAVRNVRQHAFLVHIFHSKFCTITTMIITVFVYRSPKL